MIELFQDLPFYRSRFTVHDSKYTLLFALENYQFAYFLNPFRLHFGFSKLAFTLRGK